MSSSLSSATVKYELHATLAQLDKHLDDLPEGRREGDLSAMLDELDEWEPARRRANSHFN